MHNKLKDADMENELKETFRVFSKDKEGGENTILFELLEVYLTYKENMYRHSHVDKSVSL